MADTLAWICSSWAIVVIVIATLAMLLDFEHPVLKAFFYGSVAGMWVLFILIIVVLL